MKRKLGIAFLILLAVLCLPIAVYYQPEIPVEALLDDFADDASAWIDVEGVNVHYKDEGIDAGVPLVLLHGFASSLHTWDAWVELLSDEHRVIRLDLPGHGLTGPFASAGDYRTEDYVRFVASFLDRLGVDRFVLGGNSMGGGISVQFAQRHPERVTALILIDAAGAPPLSDDVDAGRSGASRDGGSDVMSFVRLPVVRTLITRVTPRFLYEKALREVFVDDSLVTNELIDRHFRLSLREGNREALLQRLVSFGSNLKKPSAAERREGMMSMEQSALLVWGEEDLWIPPKHGERFHALLPNSELIVLPNIGHLPQEEAAETSAASVRSFLAKVNQMRGVPQDDSIPIL